MTSKYKHIIWDYNGTILHDADMIVDITCKMLAKRNLAPISLEEYKKRFRFPIKDYYDELGFLANGEDFEDLNVEYHVNYDAGVRTQCSLQPGIEDLISDLHKIGVRQSVLSAREQEILSDELKHFGLIDFLDFVSGADAITSGAKGKVDRAEELFNKIDCGKSEVAIVGDTIHDYEVAEHLGIDCFLLACGHNLREVLEKAKCSVVDDIHALRAVL